METRLRRVPKLKQETRERLTAIVSQESTLALLKASASVWTRGREGNDEGTLIHSSRGTGGES